MQKKRLKNGITVIFNREKSKSIALHVTVKTGSNNEVRKDAGISHFVEHMLFEGTKSRNARKIAADIEGIGGEIGAFTTNTRTCYYVKALKRYFSRAVDVLADILQNPLFEQKAMDKEREIILSEVKLHNDDPRDYQWELLFKALFKNHPVKNPIVGNNKNIKRITQKQILAYFEEHYCPKNMIISIVGDLKDPFKEIEHKFAKMAGKNPGKTVSVKEPSKPAVKLKSEKRDVGHSYLVVGFKTVSRKHKDSYALDVIRAILGKGLSGRMLEEIRSKRGLAYEVSVTNDQDIDYGVFAVNLSTDKKNLAVCQKLILEEFKKLDNIDESELEEGKNFVEGDFVMGNEDSQQLANEIGFLEYVKDAKLVNDYVSKVRKVTKRDVISVRDRYLKRNYAVAVVKQKR